jgi:F0F1-type ATP synthase membrane subunit b/b'
VKFDASLLVVVAIFGIAYFLLKFTLFDRMLRIFKARERRIEEAQTAWQQATAAADEALDVERQRVLAARRQAIAKVEGLRREALDRRRALLAEAGSTARGRLDAAAAELDAQRRSEETKLAGRAADLAGRISERLVGRAV